MTKYHCKKCGDGDMRKGVAIAQTFTGSPDFPGDETAVTLSPGGPGKMVKCLKCAKCGWSVMYAAAKPDQPHPVTLDTP